MDPNTTLEKIRSYVRAWHQSLPLSRDEYEDLMEHLDVMDRYLSHGGELPVAWRQESRVDHLKSRGGF